MDVDTRLLRLFVAVVEEGTLTGAAQRLYVSQPALTKQVRRLELLLGTALFHRSRSGMTLTAAGRALAQTAPRLLVDWDAAAADVKAVAAAESQVVRVGFLASAANEVTTEIVADFARRRPGWRVDMRQSSWSDPTAGLASRSVDVALVRLPFPSQESWLVEELLREPRCAVLPTGHRLASLDVIPFRKMWAEPFVAAPEHTGEWRHYWLATDEREGRPPVIGAVAEHPDDWLNAIAHGRGIALAPESTARFYARPGIVFRPVAGVSPSRVGIAWHRADRDDPVIRDLVDTCLRLAER